MGRKKELKYYNGRLKGNYLTDADCKVLESLLKLSDENGCVEDLKHVIYNLTDAEVEQVKAEKSSTFIDAELGELRPEQTVGIAYMYFAQRLVLGDSVGMGKTVEICGLCNLINQKRLKDGYTFRFLYLTDKNLVNQTRDELIKFTGEYVDVLWGEKKYIRRFAEENDGVLNYSVVGPHSLINSVEFQEYMRSCRQFYGCNPFDALFIDESSVIGNTSTKTYDNAKKLAEDFDWVIVMNATPFEKDLRTFYAQINFCDQSFLPPKTTFQKLYEVMSHNLGPYPKFSGRYKNQDIFRNQVKYRYFARTRKSIGAKMKDCKADVIVTNLSPEQKELLKKTSMPQMVYDCPSYLDDSIEMDRETTPKIGALLDLLDGELRNSSSILVYARYIESQWGIQKALLDEGISCEVMNGDTSIEEKNNLISKFKMGDIRVLVTNVQKGLNFGNCNDCVFYSYDPNPNRMVQFEGRMTRSRDIVGKNVYLLVSRGKELNRFKEVVADRANASDMFAGSDFSCVLSLLLDNERMKNLK